MTAKRALVVDDSRSARISLQKLLQKYGIGVDFAESGEDALDYLKHHVVDAIFMDHTMPGMDGLETVVAIKSNPRTATIPVMMYTANEGEVYVGQARALGALGVLPKQVQPGVLEGMLERLGLLQPASAAERHAPAGGAGPGLERADSGVSVVSRDSLQTAIEAPPARPAAPAIFAGGLSSPLPAATPVPAVTFVDARAASAAQSVPPPVAAAHSSAASSVEPQSPLSAMSAPPGTTRSEVTRAEVTRAEAGLEAQALAATLQAAVERTLSEQHARLRVDILRSHREVGQQAAEAVLAGVESAHAVDAVDSGSAQPRDEAIPATPRRSSVVTWVLLIVLALVAAALWRERVDLVAERDRLAAAVNLRDDEMARLRRTEAVGADARTGKPGGAVSERRALNTLEWALERDVRVGFDELAFGDRRANDLEALLRELQGIGFRGIVRLESHPGSFCLIEGADGQWSEAPDAAPLEACQRFGHPRDGTITEASQQSVGFASLLQQVSRLTSDQIRVELVAHDRDEAETSTSLVDGGAVQAIVPDGVLSAGEWNELARRNHRVTYTLLPVRP